MPRLSPEKQIVHGLNQIAQGHRLVKAGEKAIRSALKARPKGAKGITPAREAASQRGAEPVGRNAGPYYG